MGGTYYHAMGYNYMSQATGLVRKAIADLKAGRTGRSVRDRVTLAKTMLEDIVGDKSIKGGSLSGPIGALGQAYREMLKSADTTKPLAILQGVETELMGWRHEYDKRLDTDSARNVFG